MVCASQPPTASLPLFSTIQGKDLMETSNLGSLPNVWLCSLSQLLSDSFPFLRIHSTASGSHFSESVVKQHIIERVSIGTKPLTHEPGREGGK